MTVAFTISALLLGIIGAVAAGTGTVTPPPKIAFVTTNANVAPDALTVGPMAGRLGAPLFITNKDALGESTKDGLIDYGADLIIVAAGPNTVTDAVLAQIAAATGKTIAPPNTAPASGIVRVFGDGRDQTAVALSTLIAKYNPKFLPTDATAADADLLDGKDSADFLGATAKAADSAAVDGLTAPELQAPSALPAGRTLTGAFVTQVRAAGAGDEQAAVISYPISLDFVPNVHWIAPGGGPTADCPGSNTAPAAEPGHLCVYGTSLFNATFVCIASLEPGYACSAGSEFGVAVFITASGAGNSGVTGTWAVTAPTS